MKIKGLAYIHEAKAGLESRMNTMSCITAQDLQFHSLSKRPVTRYTTTHPQVIADAARRISERSRDEQAAFQYGISRTGLLSFGF